MPLLPPVLPQPALTSEPEPAEPHLQLVKLPPVQLELFSDEPAPQVYLWDEVTGIGTESFLEEGISVVHTPEGLSVSISGFGAHVGKKSERLVLKKKDGRAVWQLPFDRINELVLSSSGVSITTDLLTELSERGIRCSILAKNGKPVSQLNSPVLTGTVATRKAQYEAFNNGRGLNLAVSMVNGKLLNQARLLKYFAKGSRESKPELYKEIQKCISRILYHRQQMVTQTWNSLDSSRSAIMGYEGTSAQCYWDGVSRLVAERAEFVARRHRGASDFVNSCLNYGYGILYSHVWGAILNAGLEPFAGFLHTDRPGKPSLVLDLTEEFRSPVVDRSVVAAINLGQLKPEEHSGRLSQEARDVLVSKVFERLESLESFRGGEYRIRSIIQMQARQIVSVINGKAPQYRPFRFKW